MTRFVSVLVVLFFGEYCWLYSAYTFTCSCYICWLAFMVLGLIHTNDQAGREDMYSKCDTANTELATIDNMILQATSK